MFCHVGPESVLAVHNVQSVYHVPLLLQSQGILAFLRKRLLLDEIVVSKDRLAVGTDLMRRWRELTIGHDRLFDKVHIVLVGKYTSLQDSYMSVVKTLEHASLRCGRKLVLEVRRRCSDTALTAAVGRLVRPRARSADVAPSRVSRGVAGSVLGQGHPRPGRLRATRDRGHDRGGQVGAGAEGALPRHLPRLPDCGHRVCAVGTRHHRCVRLLCPPSRAPNWLLGDSLRLSTFSDALHSPLPCHS